jgi:hypothetical protein
MKNGLALENFTISDLCDDGTRSVFLHYLEADPSRPKMVRTEDKKVGEGNYADIGRCHCDLSVWNHVCPGPYHHNRISPAAGE